MTDSKEEAMSIFGNRLKYVSSKIWDTTKPDSSLHSRFRRQGRGAASGERDINYIKIDALQAIRFRISSSFLFDGCNA